MSEWLHNKSVTDRFLSVRETGHSPLMKVISLVIIARCTFFKCHFMPLWNDDTYLKIRVGMTGKVVTHVRTINPYVGILMSFSTVYSDRRKSCFFFYLSPKHMHVFILVFMA